MARIVTNIVAIIFYEDEFLIMKKRGSWTGWQFVQGGKEKGEDWETAVKREVMEETGITDVEVLEKLPFTSDYWFKSGKETIHKFQNYFLVKANKKEKVKLSIEHSDYKWCSYEEALKEIKYSKGEFEKAYKELKKLK